MEQIRHGRDTWAQFDNEDDNRLPSNNQHGNSFLDPHSFPKFTPNWASIASTDPYNSINSQTVQPKSRATHPPDDFPQQSQTNHFPTSWNQTPVDGYLHDPKINSNVSYSTTTTTAVHSTPTIPDLWTVTSEQKAYYLAQFLRLQPDPRSKLDGLQSKTFFELSNLPVDDLSKIWELTDLDQDGQLTLGEFCAAMHLVVLRRNGIPIPHCLPQALVDLITANPISSATLPTNRSSKFKSKLEKQTSEPTPPSPSGLSNASEPGQLQSPTLGTHQAFEGSNHLDGTTNHKAPNSHLPNFSEPKQRRWSISSQSDVCSLAEGMLLFESRPNPDAQLKHPIPLRVHAVPENLVETDLDHLTKLIEHDESNTVPPQSYQYPTAFPIDPDLNTSRSPVDRRPIRLHSEATPVRRDLHSLSPSHKKSAPAALSPPPPPPRAHLNLESLSGCLNSVNYRTTMDGVIQNHFSQEPITLSKPLYPSVEQHLDKDQITELQHQCDAVIQVNEQLANELMKLQKDRIALKILLERLMPLDAA